MPIFRSDDPRYRYVLTLCNYCLATLFLGMVILLSGIMLLTYVENKKNPDYYDDEKISFAKIFGIILLVLGGLFCLTSFIVCMVASFSYIKVRSSSDQTNQVEIGQATSQAT
ncbi:hypothetical protein SSS_10409 [Sarcoptes scabiei]|nr:hypothetical protein SSS_10409 [Sarcoptes scabiei]UXI20626.1 Carboxypeptidase D [Sarcoptes scabiei]